MKQLKCKFANFGIQGFGAEVLRVCRLVHYCKVNDIDFYMSEDDDWKLTPEKNGNWRSFFTSLNMTTDDMPEVTVDITNEAVSLPMTFEELSNVVKDVFKPQSKYDIDTNFNFNDEYVAIHVRRGDKVTGEWAEGLKHELSEYFSKISGRYEKRQAFVITDSPEVSKEAKEEGYLVDDTEVRRESYSYILSESDSWTDKEKEDEAFVFFKNMKLFAHANQLVGSNNSNYYMLGQLLHGEQGISLSENLVYKSSLKMKSTMRTFVLNLARREDRKEIFVRDNDAMLDDYEFLEAVDGLEITYDELRALGFDTHPDWIDPIEDTHLTKGEVGCFLSHYNAWQLCIELNEPIIIMEDDAVIGDEFNIEEIKEQMDKGYDFLYLGHREMNPYDVYAIDKKFQYPAYPYWGLAYVISPELAKKFSDDETKKNIIPVDEYLPRRMCNKKTKDKDIRCIAYRENVVEQRDRSETGTDITTGERYDTFFDFDIHAVTVGTDEKKCEKLYNSAAYHGFKFTNLGKNEEWTGGDMTIRGGGQKFNMLKEYIQDLPDRDIIFFCDAYDVFMTDSLQEMIYRYMEIGHKVLFGAERVCWPDASLSGLMESINKKHHPNLDTPYQYLNSGTFIGRVKELKQIFEKSITNSESDQLWIQYQFIDQNIDISLDTECYIFQTNEEEVQELDGQLINPITKCFTCLYHGNGGEDAKELFNQKYEDFYGTAGPMLYIPTQDYEIIQDDIILIDFLTPSMCDSIIELSERHGGFNSLSYDDVPGQELRFKELSMWNEVSKHWDNSIRAVIEKYWDMCGYYGLRDAFLIKYDLKGQRKLRLHTDASLVTGSVKLNDDYTGGELYFPRQDFSNKDVPVGKCILFPGQVTHSHTSKELESGTKFSLTMWTNRYDGDSI